jgi:hypothetical protein
MMIHFLSMSAGVAEKVFIAGVPLFSEGNRAKPDFRIRLRGYTAPEFTVNYINEVLID